MFYDIHRLSKSQVYTLLLSGCFLISSLSAQVSFPVDTANGVQSNPDVAVSDEGRSVYVWQGPLFSFGHDEIFHSIWDEAGSQVFSQRLVNNHVDGEQGHPAVAADAEGNFVIVWHSEDVAGAGFDIVAQRFDHQGLRIGNQFIVNNVTANDQLNPDVAMTAMGDFIVSWQSLSTTTGFDIKVRKFAPDGTAQGNEFIANFILNVGASAGQQKNPTISMNDSGNAIVVWESHQDGVSHDIYGNQIPNFGLDPFGQFLIAAGIESTFSTTNMANPAVTIDDAGGFVVVWERKSPFSQEISAASYNPSGSQVVLEEELIGSSIYDVIKPAIALDDTSGLLLMWYNISYEEIRLARFSMNLEQSSSTSILQDSIGENAVISATTCTQGDLFVVSDGWTTSDDVVGIHKVFPKASIKVNTGTTTWGDEPVVAVDPIGNFMVAWDAQTSDPIGIATRGFDSGGTAYQPELVSDGLAPPAALDPDIAVNAQGHYLVAYERDGADGSGSGIFAFEIDSTNVLTSQFQVNSTTAGDQSNPVVARNHDGTFVIIWESQVSPNLPSDLFGQLYDNNAMPIGSEFVVANSSDHEAHAQVAIAKDGSFTVSWIAGASGQFYPHLYARCFDQNGGPIDPPFVVDVTNNNRHQIAYDHSNVLAVAYAKDDSLLVQRYSACGQPFGGLVYLGKGNDAWIAADLRGNWLVKGGRRLRYYDRAFHPLGWRIHLETNVQDLAIDAVGNIVTTYLIGNNVHAYLYRSKPFCPSAPLALTDFLDSPFVGRSAVEITSSQLLGSGAEVYYQSGTSILLNPDFEVQAQALFTAEIVHCHEVIGNPDVPPNLHSATTSQSHIQVQQQK